MPCASQADGTRKVCQHTLCVPKTRSLSQPGHRKTAVIVMRRAGLVTRVGLRFSFFDQETAMTTGTILLVVLIILLIGALPTWPYSSGWGYGPTGGLGLLLVVLVILLVLGVI